MSAHSLHQPSFYLRVLTHCMNAHALPSAYSIYEHWFIVGMTLQCTIAERMSTHLIHEGPLNPWRGSTRASHEGNQWRDNTKTIHEDFTWAYPTKATHKRSSWKNTRVFRNAIASSLQQHNIFLGSNPTQVARMRVYATTVLGLNPNLNIQNLDDDEQRRKVCHTWYNL